MIAATSTTAASLQNHATTLMVRDFAMTLTPSAA